ncbi:MAG: hypothetical protein ABI068_12150 [Ktedonobacterales bacterium]
MSETPENTSAHLSPDLPLCPVCGLLITLTEERCPSCGASLAPSVGAEVALPDAAIGTSAVETSTESPNREAPTPPHVPGWKWALLAVDAALLVVCLALSALNLPLMTTHASPNIPQPTATATDASTGGATSQPLLQATAPRVTPTGTAGATNTGGAQPTPTSSAPTATPPTHPTATPTHTPTPPPVPTADPTVPGTGGG